MRLTLRTLLAYMDNLLESKDSQEIGKKIEESKFATDLFHKIRDVMRRLRLGAPSVTERGTNLDCNTVAEYLDNVLPADRVPDFEEVCLKSEMHLAEVASSHQILTMVLGEPAEIDPESRQRMYQLPTVASRVDEERLAAAEAATVLSGDGHAPVPPAPPVKVRPRPVVPEYLRDPPKKRRLLPAAAITFFLCAAAMLILLALGQLNQGTPIGDFLAWAQAKISGKQVVAKDDSEHGGTSDSGKDSANGGAPANGAPEASGARTPAASGSAAKASGAAAPAAAASGRAAASKDTASDPLAPPLLEPPGAHPDLTPPEPPPPPLPSGPALDNNPPPQPLPPAGTAAEKGVAPMGPPPAAAVGGAPLPIVPVPPPVANIESAPPSGPTIPSTTDNGATQPGANSKEVAMAPKPAPPPAVDDKAKVARFTSNGQDVLLKLDPRTAVWRRVLPEEFLTANETLLSLPSYRSRVDIFDVGATLELLNGTRVELMQGAAPAPPGVDIDYGHLVIKPLAQAGARLRVSVGTHLGTITLANIDTVAGLEVTREHERGTDPEKVLSHALTRLYVARGSVTWEEAGKDAVHLTAPAELLLDGSPADAPKGNVDVPKWITANTIDELDQRAAVLVSQNLQPERPASLGLMELTEHRQKEVRWLAARCMGYLGQFDPLTAALNDPDYRREWPDYFAQLEEAIARGPETAAGIRQSLEKQFGDNAAALYRMLWGYTDKDLAAGDDGRLVKNLDNENLIFRVLAFSNLKEIAHKSLTYHPEYTAAKRLAAVQRWRQEEKLGQIRWSPAAPKSKSLQPAGSAAPPATAKPDDAPGEVNPAGVIEPIAPEGARRPPVVVPEPEPPTNEPRAVVPEPASDDSP